MRSDGACRGWAGDRARWAACAVAALVFANPALADGPPDAEASLRDTALLFTSLRTGSPQIFRMGADGGDERRLTQTDTAELQAVWSRTGRIAFVSYRSGGGDLYTMAADGSDLRRLTDGPGLEHNPVWSPDGARLAFVGERDGRGLLAVVNADGSGLRVVSEVHGEVGGPAWSPDGRQLAFVAAIAHKPRIVLADLATGTTRPLTRGGRPEFGPVWAPDGQSIAYVESGSRTEGVNLRLARLDGSEPVALTRNGYINSQPQFSPDGTRLLFLSNAASQGGPMKLHLMHSDGTGVRPLTDSPHADMGGNWSADGRHVYFMGFQDWPGQIYRARADGSQIQRLTRTRSQEGIPAVWAPPDAGPRPARSP